MELVGDRRTVNIRRMAVTKRCTLPKVISPTAKRKFTEVYIIPHSHYLLVVFLRFFRAPLRQPMQWVCAAGAFGQQTNGPPRCDAVAVVSRLNARCRGWMASQQDGGCMEGYNFLLSLLSLSFRLLRVINIYYELKLETLRCEKVGEKVTVNLLP